MDLKWTESEKRGLLAAARLIRDWRRHDPHVAQWPYVLIEIALQDPTNPPTLTELATSIGMPQPTLARLARALETGDDKLGPRGGLGLVMRKPHPRNYKALIAQLTPAGHSLVRDMIHTMREVT